MAPEGEGDAEVVGAVVARETVRPRKHAFDGIFSDEHAKVGMRNKCTD